MGKKEAYSIFMKMKTRSAKRTPRLGQHFLTNPTVARSLVEAAQVKKGSVVVEIGPGTGALTRELLAAGGTVFAVEKDTSLVSQLRELFMVELENGTLKLFEMDVRDALIESMGVSAPYVLAANIPYYITGEIIRRFLTMQHQPETMALLIQKEVADRIVAKDGKESILSLSVKAYGVPRIVRKVPAGNFNPPPSVDSAIIGISHISRAFFDTISENDFFSVIKRGFGSKRKLLSGNLSSLIPKEVTASVLISHGLSASARAEELPLPVWKDLVAALKS